MPIASDKMTPLKRALAEQERSYAWLARKVAVDRGTVLRWAEGLHVPSEATRLKVASTLGLEADRLWKPEAGADTLKDAA